MLFKILIFLSLSSCGLKKAPISQNIIPSVFDTYGHPKKAKKKEKTQKINEREIKLK